jgi:DNA-binding LacI/PurR family transcriptional regulator
MGYRPDPVLTQLMQHLRENRTVKTSSSLAVLTDMKAGFVQRLIKGATERAAKLGYTIDRLDPTAFTGRPAALTRTLQARGMSGLLIAPASVPADIRELLNWDRFAVQAMTYSVIEPHIHRVVAHHFDNAVRTFALLVERGFRRIGLAVTGDMEFRTNHTYSAAYYRAVHVHSIAELPFLMLGDRAKNSIASWFSRSRPDAIVLANAGHLRRFVIPALGENVVQKAAFVTLDVEPGHSIAGIDQRFEIIGSHAVDGVVAQIHRNERGIPSAPVVSMVEGRWTEPNGLRPSW